MIKKLITLLAFGIPFVSSISAQDSLTMVLPKAELMSIHTFYVIKKILVTHSNGESETIEMEIQKGTERVIENERIFLDLLTGFYKKGWTIETGFAINISEGAYYYILKREQ